jgi:hypothetical protein
MSNPPPVKTAFSNTSPPATGAARVVEAGPSGEKAAGGAPADDLSAADPSAVDPSAVDPSVVDPSVVDPAVAALVRLLRPAPEPRVHPQAESQLPLATGMEISLGQFRLRVVQRGEVLVESPLAVGRALSPTPEGTFTLAAKPETPTSLRYGHYRTRSGALLMRGVFPKIDLLPPDAVFDPIEPKGLMQLSGEGPLLFGGEATGAATSDGTLVLPDRIALLLHEKLPLGLPVTITR